MCYRLESNSGLLKTRGSSCSWGYKKGSGNVYLISCIEFINLFCFVCGFWAYLLLLKTSFSCAGSGSYGNSCYSFGWVVFGSCFWRGCSKFCEIG